MDEEEDRTPSQEHDTENIDGLVESVRLQSTNIEALAGGLVHLGNQIKERPTRGGVWKIVGFVGGAIVILMLVLQSLAYVSSRGALNEIKSCTTPTGECSQRGAESQVNAIGQIVCNQEKILYFSDNDYPPFSYCIEFINNEIDRTGVAVVKLPVPEDVPQIVP